jgi:hypothetical protein
MQNISAAWIYPIIVVGGGHRSFRLVRDQHPRAQRLARWARR